MPWLKKTGPLTIFNGSRYVRGKCKMSFLMKIMIHYTWFTMKCRHSMMYAYTLGCMRYFKNCSRHPLGTRFFQSWDPFFSVSAPVFFSQGTRFFRSQMWKRATWPHFGTRFYLLGKPFWTRMCQKKPNSHGLNTVSVLRNWKVIGSDFALCFM